MENIRMAHKNARRDKSFYSEVQQIDNDKDEIKLKEIQNMLINKTYSLKLEDYTVFEKFDKTKIRQIWKVDYSPHRIIAWAIINQIGDIIIKSISKMSCASIPNRGIHYALNFSKKYIREYDYYLKIDIKKYFPNINQDILIKLLNNKFKDKDLMDLLTVIIKSTPSGIPIGSLTSQYFAIFYIDRLNRLLESIKDIKFITYMDDVVIFANNKSRLHEVFNIIEKFLKDELDLKIKENWCIRPSRCGLDFVGYVVFREYIRIRQSTKNKMVKKINKINKQIRNGKELTYSQWCSINSYGGWLKFGNCYNLYKKHLLPLRKYSKEYYFKNIKNIKVILD